MKKIIFLTISLIATICVFSSCSKTCTCTATLNDQVLDQVVYEDISGTECEAKVDEAMNQVMQNYDPQSLVGLSISCSHL